MKRTTRKLASLTYLPLLRYSVAVLVCVGTALGPALPASAATTVPSSSSTTTATTTDQAFSLQVSPSPLVATVEPGKSTTLDLHITNTASQSQNLAMGLRTFTVSESTGQVDLGKTAPSDIATFVSFSDPTFTVQAGQIFTERVIIHTPTTAGFTYSFAIAISQQKPPKAKAGTSTIAGSVAVFTLLSVDKPGATRKLELNSLSVSRHVYQYLPATISIKLKNTGNTLVQPKGTIFIQRHANDAKPLAAITLNASGGYILPGDSRSLTTTWNDGFPYYKTTITDGVTKTSLNWNGGNFTKLRFGKYVAKVVATYDDGERDVPINAQITFWVIPWLLVVIVLVVVLFVLVGIVTIIRRSTKVLKRGKKRDAAVKI